MARKHFADIGIFLTVAKQVRDGVRNEVQRLDVAGLIGERISQIFSGWKSQSQT